MCDGAHKLLDCSHGRSSMRGHVSCVAKPVELYDTSGRHQGLLALAERPRSALLQMDMAEVLALAAAAEVSSEHPLAAAILAHAEAALAPPPADALSPAGGAADSAPAVEAPGGSSPRDGALGRGGGRDLSWVRRTTELEVLPGR